MGATRKIFLAVALLAASITVCEADEYEYVFQNKNPFPQTFTGSTSASLGGVTWTLVSPLNYADQELYVGGICLSTASGNHFAQEVSLFTDGIVGSVTGVEVLVSRTSASTATDVPTLNVRVGEQDYGTQSMVPSATQPLSFPATALSSTGKITLKFSNASGKTKYGIYLKSIKITYTPHFDAMTLDETKDNSTTISGMNGKRVNATLTRTFTADGGWYTLCLPFSLSAAQVADVFGQGTDIQTFSAVTKSGGRVSSVVFSPKEDGYLAGQPCMICPAQSVENPVFSDVTISATSPSSTVVDDCSFIGLYSPYSIPYNGEYSILSGVDGSHLVGVSNDGKQIHGTRAYFHFPNGQATEARAQFGSSTGIKSVRRDAMHSSTYTIQGVRVDDGVKLPAGIYIRGGRKVVIGFAGR